MGKFTTMPVRRLSSDLTNSGKDSFQAVNYHAGMPARIGPKNPRRIYYRQWREYHRLTQQQVADRMGTTGVTISRWETGARPGKPEAYAEALGEPVERLYQLPPTPEPWQPRKRPSGADSELHSLIAEIAAEVLRRRNVR